MLSRAEEYRSVRSRAESCRAVQCSQAPRSSEQERAALSCAEQMGAVQSCAEQGRAVQERAALSCAPARARAEVHIHEQGTAAVNVVRLCGPLFTVVGSRDKAPSGLAEHCDAVL